MPFLIKENFLPEHYLSYVLEEIKRLKNSYSRDGYFNRRTIRDNLDPRFCGTQIINNPRNILYSLWNTYFWKNIEQDFIDTCDSGFIHSLYTKHGHVLLSSYGDGDYYGTHIDVDLGCITTAVLMLSFNHKFEGGDLVLNCGEDVIPFQNNKLIVFPSCTPHEVTKIKLDSKEYTDNRFSLQYFISAVPLKKTLVDESRNIE